MIERLGLALLKPRFALAVAGERRNAGRSGSDLFALIALVVLATQLRGLVAAVWVGVITDIGLMLRGVTGVLTQTLTIDLAFLIVGALALWILAGKRPRQQTVAGSPSRQGRDIGRAFDLACVVALPLLFVQLGATVVVRAIDVVVPLELPRLVSNILAAASYAWAGIVFAYAIAARPSTKPFPALPDEVSRPARRAGWAIMAVVALGLVIQVVWIAQHPELVRPMQKDDPAPALALPSVTVTGDLGPVVTMPAGKLVVVDFWATWCKPCLASMPDLDRLTRQHANVAVIAVNVDDPIKAREIFDAQHYAMTLVFDDSDTATRYGVQSYPHTVLIGRDGRVRAVSRGGSSVIANAVNELDH